MNSIDDITNFIFVEDTPIQADIIFLPGGSNPALPEKAAELYLADHERIYLYHQNWFWSLSSKVTGFKPHPDGMIRLEGVSVAK